MDLLAGYGSDVSEDDATAAIPSNQQPIDPFGNGYNTRVEQYQPAPRKGSSAGTTQLPQGFFDASVTNQTSLNPNPPNTDKPKDDSTSGGTLFKSLPPPTTNSARSARAKRAVKLRLPINVDLANLESDEEDQPKKKLKTSSSKGLKLADVLPPPKNEFGVGLATGRRVDTEQQNLSDEEKDDPILDPNGEGLASAVGLSYTNETYYQDQPEDAPVAQQQETEASADDPYYYNQHPEPTAHDPYYYNEQSEPTTLDPYHYNQYYQYGEAQPTGVSISTQPQPASAPLPVHPSAFLDAALQAEQEKARKQGKRLDRDGVKILEVNQKELTYVDPARKAEMTSLRTAMGEGYEATLRSQAGPAPNKLAKRKHQISSLYHQSKLKELELLEKRGQSLKTKAETQAKYGWA